jgi:ATP-dependent Lon protease
MTGEITLSGLVFPVGGIKEKVLAAYRAGIRRVILPSRNDGDVEDIAEDVRKNLELVFVSRISEVIDASLEVLVVNPPPPPPPRSDGARDRSSRQPDAEPIAVRQA